MAGKLSDLFHTEPQKPAVTGTILLGLKEVRIPPGRTIVLSESVRERGWLRSLRLRPSGTIVVRVNLSGLPLALSPDDIDEYDDDGFAWRARMDPPLTDVRCTPGECKVGMVLSAIVNNPGATEVCVSGEFTLDVP